MEEQMMTQSDGWRSRFWLLFFGFVLWNVIKSARIVPTQKNLVVERFGRYLKTLGPGLHFLIPFADRVTASLDIHEKSFEVPPQDCERVEVVEFIPSGGEGRISFRGTTWKARFASGSQDAAKVGSRVTIRRVTTLGQDNITFIVGLEEADQNGKPNQPTGTLTKALMKPRPEENLTSSTIPDMRLPRIFWGGFLMFQILLGVILCVVKLPTMGPEWAATVDLSPNGILRTLLTTIQKPVNAVITAVGAVAAIAGLVVPTRLFKASSRKTNPAPLEPASDGSDPEIPVNDRFPFFVMRLAFFEMFAVLGFVQGFEIPGNPVLFIPFWLVSIGLHVSQFPRDLSLGFKRDDETSL